MLRSTTIAQITSHIALGAALLSAPDASWAADAKLPPNPVLANTNQLAVGSREVLFVPLKHFNGPLVDIETISSQHKVALFLSSRTNLMVIDEGARSITTRAELLKSPRLEKLDQEIRTSFENGIPRAASELTEKQRALLYYPGAPMICLSLGKIASVFPAIAKEDWQLLQTGVNAIAQEYNGDKDEAFRKSSHFRFLVVDFKEAAVRAEMARVASEPKRRNEQMVFLCGGGHLLGLMDAQILELHFRIPSEFELMKSALALMEKELMALLVEDRKIPFQKRAEETESYVRAVLFRAAEREPKSKTQ